MTSATRASACQVSESNMIVSDLSHLQRRSLIYSALQVDTPVRASAASSET